MKLEEIMSSEEQDAVTDFIRAYWGKRNAELNLQEAQEDYAASAGILTSLFFKDYGTMPESFATTDDDGSYFIQIDVDGENQHVIKLISGVLSKEKE